MWKNNKNRRLYGDNCLKIKCMERRCNYEKKLGKDFKNIDWCYLR